MGRFVRFPLVAALGWAAAACGEAPEGPRLTPAPDGGLPVEIRAMIHGDDTPCATGEDCMTGQCLFGRCSGVVRTDEPWRTELVADRLVSLIGDDAALRRQVIDELVRLGATPDLSEPTRARLLWALEKVGGAAALRAAAPELGALPDSLQAVVALGLARHGDATGVSLVLALTESERPALRVEALRALGGLGAGATEDVKARLLAVATGEVDEMEALAALQALAELRPPGAVAPLLALAEGGREALREPALLALAAVTGKAHGSDPAAWRTALEAAGLPAAIEFTSVVARPEDDIGLPDP